MRNTGKTSEAEVRQALQSINLRSFDWQRMYDATSARNAFMSQVGDFQWMMPGHHGVIEVKSTKHTYRLGKSAFRENQIAKLRKRMDAGGLIYIFVHHYTAGYWRLIHLDKILRTFGDNQQASIDLRDYKTYLSASELLFEVIQEALKKSR